MYFFKDESKKIGHILHINLFESERSGRIANVRRKLSHSFKSKNEFASLLAIYHKLIKCHIDFVVVVVVVVVVLFVDKEIFINVDFILLDNDLNSFLYLNTETKAFRRECVDSPQQLHQAASSNDAVTARLLSDYKLDKRERMNNQRLHFLRKSDLIF